MNCEGQQYHIMHNAIKRARVQQDSHAVVAACDGMHDGVVAPVIRDGAGVVLDVAAVEHRSPPPLHLHPWQACWLLHGRSHTQGKRFVIYTATNSWLPGLFNGSINDTATNRCTVIVRLSIKLQLSDQTRKA